MPDTVSAPRKVSLSIDGATSGDGARASDCSAEARRSANNIAAWMSYLPKDCVETMIAMGWDKTT